MSTVTSCNLLCGRPAATPVNISGSRLQFGKAAAVALPCFQTKSRPLSVCLAKSAKGEHNPKTDLLPFQISPVALVHPVAPLDDRCRREEDANAVKLRFEVPGLSEDDLVVEIDEDVLVIRKNPKADENTPTAGAAYGSGVYARLLVPAGYNRESVKAKLDSGVLWVTIAKVKEHARRRINVNIDGEREASE